MSDLKSEIRERDKRIINLIEKIEEMKGKLNLLYVVRDEKRKVFIQSIRKIIIYNEELHIISREKYIISNGSVTNKYIEKISVSMVKVNCFN